MINANCYEATSPKYPDAHPHKDWIGRIKIKKQSKYSFKCCCSGYSVSDFLNILNVSPYLYISVRKRFDERLMS